jgi:hypothetical protein
MRLPSTYGFREFCDAGGLLCCGSNLQVQFGRFRYFIDPLFHRQDIEGHQSWRRSD